MYVSHEVSVLVAALVRSSVGFFDGREHAETNVIHDLVNSRQ